MTSRCTPRPLARCTFRLGLALTVLIATLWAASLKLDFGWVSPGPTTFAIGFGAGRLQLGRLIPADSPPDPYRGWYGESRVDFRQSWHWRYDALGGNILVAIPLWAPFLAALVTTLLAWRRLRRRLNPGLCPACSYPRSGLAPNAPCPECGRR